jgi:DNA-binding transcriptional LysR family regulator
MHDLENLHDNLFWRIRDDRKCWYPLRIWVKQMEVQQIRYSLAAACTLNFTRAAEECNVTQPSLTRAIQQLEEELGGDLLRRERKLSHLTDLSQRMLPLMQQCHDMAQCAKTLAGSIKRGEIASLRLGLTRTIDISLLVSYLSELNRAVQRP